MDDIGNDVGWYYYQDLSAAQREIMHLYFYIRGINQQVELWKLFAQTQWWRWIRTNLKTKKIEETLVQGALRPSVFGAWEYIFPEECLAEVLTSFKVVDAGSSIGAEPTRKNKAGLFVLRKLFGCKKIPKKIYEEAKKIQGSVMINGYWRGISQLNIPGVSIHIIGYKEDVRKKVEKWGYEQEML